MPAFHAGFLCQRGLKPSGLPARCHASSLIKRTLESRLSNLLHVWGQVGKRGHVLPKKAKEALAEAKGYARHALALAPYVRRNSNPAPPRALPDSSLTFECLVH